VYLLYNRKTTHFGNNLDNPQVGISLSTNNFTFTLPADGGIIFEYSSVPLSFNVSANWTAASGRTPAGYYNAGIVNNTSSAQTVTCSMATGTIGAGHAFDSKVKIPNFNNRLNIDINKSVDTKKLDSGRIKHYSSGPTYHTISGDIGVYSGSNTEVFTQQLYTGDTLGITMLDSVLDYFNFAVMAEKLDVKYTVTNHILNTYKLDLIEVV